MNNALRVVTTIASWCEFAIAPRNSPNANGWSHTGVVVQSNGDILTLAPSTSDLLTFDGKGLLIRSAPLDVIEGHSLTLACNSRGSNSLWIADCAKQNVRTVNGRYKEWSHPGPRQGKVAEFSLDGTQLRELPRPPLHLYRGGDYRPTDVVIDESQHGGNGDIWVADGYGQQLVHRYTQDGDYSSSLHGEQSMGGPFKIPHSLHLDRRRNRVNLLIADRENHRICRYDIDGNYMNAFGFEHLRMPCGMATIGDILIVADLAGCLTIFDMNDHFIMQLGLTAEVAMDRPDWPNMRTQAGTVQRPNLFPKYFNSPHGVGIGPDGTIVVCEWLIGGRIVVFRLDDLSEPVTPTQGSGRNLNYPGGLVTAALDSADRTSTSR